MFTETLVRGKALETGSLIVNGHFSRIVVTPGKTDCSAQLDQMKNQHTAFDCIKIVAAVA